jgi:Domain of unknown function (DUF5664)
MSPQEHYKRTVQNAREQQKNEAAQRKQHPLFTGLFNYFPDALMEVAHASWVGSQQHTPGVPIFWDRSKSTDQLDCLLRHAMEHGKRDSDGVRHMAKAAWRALAELQLEIERDRGPMPVPLSVQNPEPPPTPLGAEGGSFIGTAKQLFGQGDVVVHPLPPLSPMPPWV